MSELLLHPMATAMPPASDAEYEALKESIKANGQMTKIILVDGLVFDGRNRLNVCQDLGIEPVCRDATQAELGDGSDDALIRLSVGLNVSRRHLSKSQKAIAAARLVSGTHGGDRSKLSNDNLKIESLAGQFGIGVAHISRARQLISEAEPKVIDLVFNGKLTLSAALQSYKVIEKATTPDPLAAKPEVLSKALDREKKRNAKLVKERDALRRSADGQRADKNGLAKLLDDERANNAKLQAIADATPNQLVAEAKILYRTDPETKALIDEQRIAIDRLKTESAQAKAAQQHAEAVARELSETHIDKSRKLALLEAPAQYLASFGSTVLIDFSKHLDHASGAVGRMGIDIDLSLHGQLLRVRDKIDAVVEAIKDHTAVNGDAQKTPLKQIGKSDLKEITV